MVSLFQRRPSFMTQKLENISKIFKWLYRDLKHLENTAHKLHFFTSSLDVIVRYSSYLSSETVCNAHCLLVNCEIQRSGFKKKKAKGFTRVFTAVFFIDCFTFFSIWFIIHSRKNHRLKTVTIIR